MITNFSKEIKIVLDQLTDFEIKKAFILCIILQARNEGVCKDEEKRLLDLLNQ